ncbi:hypothetical protein GW17_00060068 [Ensete ventricosum]|nr:hypothetical protein GW17_00060068 [Ensete ventricosum]
MRHELPPWHHGSRYHLYAPTTLLHIITTNHKHPAAVLARRQPPYQGAAILASSAAALAEGRALQTVAPASPMLQAIMLVGRCGLAIIVRACEWLLPLRATVSTGGHLWDAALAGSCQWASKCPLTGSLGRSRLPLQPAWPWVVALARGLAIAGHPCKGSGHGWPHLLAAFTTKIQPKHVERFYVIQSHHIQYKTNLSHKNLGSNTTVGKP